MTGRKIVMIEDSKAASTVLKEVLESEGHTVLLASDGVAGLGMARRETPDCWICCSQNLTATKSATR
jgi:CheY-like chemotaxis protein